LEAARCFPYFLVFSKHFFIVKIIHHAIIDESGIYLPVGDQHNDFCRQREAEDGSTEGAHLLS
jgi:hypothetical protein